MKTPETILISNANLGFGLELVKQIMIQPKLPKVLFAAGNFSPEDRSILNHMVEEYPRLMIVDMDTKSDESIEQAYNKIHFELGDYGLTLLINNNAVVDSHEVSLEEQSRMTMLTSFEMSATGKDVDLCQHLYGVGVHSRDLPCIPKPHRKAHRGTRRRPHLRKVPVMMAKTFSPLLQKAAQLRPLAYGFCRAGIINMTFAFRDLPASTAVNKSYHYRAARSALNAVTHLLAQELKEVKVCVAAIQPGWIDSGASENSFDEEHSETMQKLWNTITTLSDSSDGMIYNYDGIPLPS